MEREAEDGRDWTQFLELAPRQRARELFRKVREHEVLVLLQPTVVRDVGRGSERLTKAFIHGLHT